MTTRRVCLDRYVLTGMTVCLYNYDKTGMSRGVCLDIQKPEEKEIPRLEININLIILLANLG